jgi:DNA-binding NarL/FixJ family response regulator
MTGEAIRVAIVDDHPMYRMGLAGAIREMHGIELVGEADCVAQVPELIGEQAPDVLLLDIRLPDGNGLDVNRWLGEDVPAVKVIMLTMADDHESADTALRDGARGYLVKGVEPDKVECAIRAVMLDLVVLDEAISQDLTEPEPIGPRPTRSFPELTDREYETLELVADGHDNASIARLMYTSPKTARNRVSMIMAKVHAKDRAELIVRARQDGLGSAKDPERTR